MALSDAEKAKIAEEERFRAEQRAQLSQPKPVPMHKRRVSGPAGCLIVILLFVGIGWLINRTTSSPATPAASPTPKFTEEQKKSAQEYLDTTFATLTQTGVIKEVKDGDIYVDRVWYNLPITQKEELVGNIASAYEITTGKITVFSVKDYYSGEEVAKFGLGGTKVYK